MSTISLVVVGIDLIHRWQVEIGIVTRRRMRRIRVHLELRRIDGAENGRGRSMHRLRLVRVLGHLEVLLLHGILLHLGRRVIRLTLQLIHNDGSGKLDDERRRGRLDLL